MVIEQDGGWEQMGTTTPTGLGMGVQVIHVNVQLMALVKLENSASKLADFNNVLFITIKLILIIADLFF